MGLTGIKAVPGVVPGADVVVFDIALVNPARMLCLVLHELKDNLDITGFSFYLIRQLEFFYHFVDSVVVKDHIEANFFRLQGETRG